MEKNIIYLFLLTFLQINLVTSTTKFDETVPLCKLCDRFLDGDIKCSTTGFKYKGGQILQKRTIIPFTVHAISQNICKIEVSFRHFGESKSFFQKQIIYSNNQSITYPENGLTMALERPFGHQMLLTVEGLLGWYFYTNLSFSEFLDSVNSTYVITINIQPNLCSRPPLTNLKKKKKLVCTRREAWSSG